MRNAAFETFHSPRSKCTTGCRASSVLALPRRPSNVPDAAAAGLPRADEAQLASTPPRIVMSQSHVSQVELSCQVLIEGESKTVTFPMDFATDTPESVAREMNAVDSASDDQPVELHRDLTLRRVERLDSRGFMAGLTLKPKT